MGTLEKIDHALQRLFRWNLRKMIELSIPKVNRLRFQGRWEKALEILQNILEIEETDYEDPRRVFLKLRDRLSVVDPSMAVAFLIQYLNVLADSGRQALVPALLELDAGIGPEDYADPQGLSSLLQRRLAGLDPAQGFFYGAIFASTLGESDRPADALAVSQALLGDPVAPIEAPFRLRPKPEKVDLSSWWGAVATVSTFLLQTGRWSEAVGLLEDLYGSLDTLPEGEDQEISPFDQWMLLLPMGMFLLGSPEGWSEFERLVGVEPDDYRDEARLASKLRALTAEVPPDFGANVIAMWLLALAELRPEDALAVLRVDAGLTPSDWRDPERLALRLQERCRKMPADTTGRYLLSAAAALSGSSHPALAAVALEADADLAAVDWVDGKELASRLDQRMAGLAGTTRLGYRIASSPLWFTLTVRKRGPFLRMPTFAGSLLSWGETKGPVWPQCPAGFSNGGSSGEGETPAINRWRSVMRSSRISVALSPIRVSLCWTDRVLFVPLEISAAAPFRQASTGLLTRESQSGRGSCAAPSFSGTWSCPSGCSSNVSCWPRSISRPRASRFRRGPGLLASCRPQQKAIYPISWRSPR